MWRAVLFSFFIKVSINLRDIVYCQTHCRRKGKMRVSLSRRSIYEAKEEARFCSHICYQNALKFITQLDNTPPQMRPSLQKVFGTSSPSPWQTPTAKTPTQIAPRLATPKQIWANATTHGSVIEPNPDKMNIAPMKKTLVSLSTVPPSVPVQMGGIKENKTPKPLSTKFPTVEEAVLIEGCAVSAREYKMVAKKEDDRPEGEEQNDDEDEDESSEEEVDSDDDPLCLDPKRDLPYFANLWRKLNGWTTYNSSLCIRSCSGRTTCPHQTEAEHRQSVYVSRRDAFWKNVGKGMEAIKEDLSFEYSVQFYQRVFELTGTFNFPEAISAYPRSEVIMCKLSIVTSVIEYLVVDCSSVYPCLHLSTQRTANIMFKR